MLEQVVAGRCLIYAIWPNVLISTISGILTLLIEFFIPLIILIYCYGRIVWMLTRRLDSGPLDNRGSHSDKFQLARTNTIKTFLLVGLCFIICWSNNQVYYFMYNLGYNADFEGTYNKFGILMVFGNCTVNPFIYLIKYKDFQQALKEFTCRKRSRAEEQSNTKSSSLST